METNLRQRIVGLHKNAVEAVKERQAFASRRGSLDGQRPTNGDWMEHGA
jgi:hypothetical protein